MTAKRQLILPIIALHALLWLQACKKSTATPPLYANSTLQTIQRDPQLIILNAAIQRSRLDTVFAGGGPFTVFAATDSAFVTAGYPLSRILAMDPDSLQPFIGYSIVKGRISSTDLIGFLSQKFTSLNANYNPQITKNYYGIFFNGNFVTAQIPTGDGVINKIAGFSAPPVGTIFQTINNAPNLTLCAYILGKNVILGNSSLGPLYLNTLLQYPPDSIFQYYSTSFKNMTLFLPTDSAFAAAGYTTATIDSFYSVRPDLFVNNIISYWLAENEFFTSDFLFTGFLIGPAGGNAGVQLPTKTQFFQGAATYSFLGIRPDARTMYSFTFNSTVADNLSQAAFTVGHIVQPNIIATNGTIHLVDSVFHF